MPGLISSGITLVFCDLVCAALALLPLLPSAIISIGIIISREYLGSLFEAKEREVASKQEYMN